MRIILGTVFLLGLIYLILPGPQRIEQFSRLPISLKSQLAGDTIQNPNIAAYFSDYDRSYVTKFYYQNFRSLYCQTNFLNLPNPLCFIPPLKINHPPEEAFVYIRDQQESTYLEEYLFPFRESFFVNGYEPVDKKGRLFKATSIPLQVDSQFYFSKATIRFYPTLIWSRLIVYLGIWAISFYLVRFIKKELKQK